MTRHDQRVHENNFKRNRIGPIDSEYDFRCRFLEIQQRPGLSVRKRLELVVDLVVLAGDCRNRDVQRIVKGIEMAINLSGRNFWQKWEDVQTASTL